MEDSNVKQEPNQVRKPNPKHFVKKVECGDSLYGDIWGSLILLISVINLGLFFGLQPAEEHYENHGGKENLHHTQETENTQV